jgi:hypothetical protein
MTTVLGDPDERYAVDWDWDRRLTVWTLAGRSFEARYEDKVLQHELPARPSGERKAQAAARHWWRTQGRAEALAAAAASADGQRSHDER